MSAGGRPLKHNTGHAQTLCSKNARRALQHIAELLVLFIGKIEEFNVFDLLDKAGSFGLLPLARFARTCRT